MYTKLHFVVLIEVLLNFVNCYYVSYQNTNDVPCGLRYNDRSAETTEDQFFDQQSGRSLLSKALDDTDGKLNSKKSKLVDKQQLQLQEILNKLRKLTNHFDETIQQSFNKIMRESEKVLSKAKKNSSHHLSSVKRNVDQFNDKVDKKKVASNINDLMIKSRSLIKKIQKNLLVKTRIIGGSYASIKGFPWLVSIQIFQGSHICGGSIITPYFVLTAAHCVSDENTNELANRKYTISVGSSYWKKGKTYEVQKVNKHPGFTFQTFRNDIAIMRIDPPIHLVRGRIAPICLPPKGVEVYGSATIAGWGVIDNDLTTANEHLMSVNIQILNDKFCTSKYGNFNAYQMICAGHLKGGKDSCQGDSGGPMQCMLQNKRVYLMGAVSFGDLCGKALFPGVYTKISSYIDWIYQQMDQMSNEYLHYSTRSLSPFNNSKA